MTEDIPYGLGPYEAAAREWMKRYNLDPNKMIKAERDEFDEHKSFFVFLFCLTNKFPHWFFVARTIKEFDDIGKLHHCFSEILADHPAEPK